MSEIKKLCIFERLAIKGILPQEGTFLSMKTLRKLKSKLDVTEKEWTDYKLEFVPIEGTDRQRPVWDPCMNDPTTTSKFVETDFEFGVKEEEMIKDALKKKETDKKITESEITLYEKFIEIPEVGETGATRE